MAEGVTVEELGGPLQNRDETTQYAEEDVTGDARNASLRSRLAPGKRAKLAKEADNGHEQATERNRSKAVGERALEGTSGGVLGEVVRAKVP